MDNGFTFNGTHVNDLGAAFIVNKWPGSATATINEATVSGRHGTIRYDGQTYGIKSLEGTLYLLDPNDEVMSYTRMMERVDEVIAWLCPGGRRRLVLDAQPERFYEAEITQEISFVTNDWENGAATLKFALQPFSYASQKTMLRCTLRANLQQSRSLALPGNVDGPLLAVVTAAAAITWVEITVGGKALRLEGLALQSGDVLTIDALPENGEVTTVKINESPSRGLVTKASCFPLFVQPGSNAFTAAADGDCTIEMGARGRWK